MVTLNGRSGRLAEALLKIGLCYQNLREPGRAQQSWRRVVADHPDSEAAQKARSCAEPTPTVNEEARYPSRFLTRVGACAHSGAHVDARHLTPQDPEYPSLLAAIPSPPELWMRGELQPDDALAIAIVGTRRASAYGLAAAERLAFDLAARGVTIVSGLARASTRRRIAVPSRPADARSPCWARASRSSIPRERGARSDDRAAAPSSRSSRPACHRWPATFRRATARWPVSPWAWWWWRHRSVRGAHHRRAGRRARPRSIRRSRPNHDRNGRGSNRLIQDGAKLVRDWHDVVEELPNHWRSAVRSSSQQTNAADGPAPDSEEGQILALLTPESPQHIETLIARRGGSAARVAAALLALELEARPVNSTASALGESPPGGGRSGAERRRAGARDRGVAHEGEDDQKYLAGRYIVKASMGHVRDLPKSSLGVDPKKNFKPKYVVTPAKKKVLDDLKKAAEKVDALYVATDPDREGEAIGWHLVQELPVDKRKVYRVTFNEITERAVRQAFEHPGKIDLKKVDAQQAPRAGPPRRLQSLATPVGEGPARAVGRSCPVGGRPAHRGPRARDPGLPAGGVLVAPRQPGSQAPAEFMAASRDRRREGLAAQRGGHAGGHGRAGGGTLHRARSPG